jgi:hypothetical protein
VSDKVSGFRVVLRQPVDSEVAEVMARMLGMVEGVVTVELVYHNGALSTIDAARRDIEWASAIGDTVKAMLTRGKGRTDG